MKVLRGIYAVIVGIILVPYWIVWSIFGGYEMVLMAIACMKLWVKYGNHYFEHFAEIGL